MNLVEALHRHARERGSHRALVIEPSIEGGERLLLDFATLEQRLRALAAVLQAQGAAGQRVLVVCPPGLDFIVALGACFFAGAVAVPCRPPQLKLADRGLAHFGALLADAQPLLALTPAEHVERARWFGNKAGLPLKWLAAEAPVAEASAWRMPEISVAALALLQYTSGSTGSPRGVPITQANLEANLAFIAERYGVGAESVVVNWLPPHHDMGLIGHTLLPLMLGCTSVHLSPLDFLKSPRRWLAAVSEHRGTHGGGPNFGYELCVRGIAAEARVGLDLSSWQAAPVAAEPIRAATLARFCEAYAEYGFRPETFAPCYGLAESTLMATAAGGRRGRVRQLRAERAALASGQVRATEGDAAAVILVSCGQPATGAQVAVVAPESGRPCADGEIGEIWISGPSVASEYWRRASEVFGARLTGSKAAWHRSGDLGALQDGELYVTGRLKDLIIVAGRNIYPSDLEVSTCASHPALAPERSAAFGIEGEWGEEVVLVCELRREQRTPLNADEVFAAIRAALLQDCELAPATILLVPERSLPVTGSGKIRHAECRKRHLAQGWEVLARSDATGAAPEPESQRPEHPAPGDIAATQRYLIACLADMMRREPQWVQPQQKLSHLGLDSLGRVELTLRLEADLSIRLPPESLSSDPTVVQLSQRLVALTLRSRAPKVGASRRARLLHAADPVGASLLATNPAQIIASDTTPAELPLLPLQSEFLWDGVTDPGRFATLLILRTPAGTIESSLAAALVHLEQEFDALRLRFDRPGGRWRQRLVADGGAVKFSRVDVSGVDAERRRALRKQLQEQLVSDLDITSGPLLRAIWFDGGAGATGVLGIAVHHLVSDGLSLIALIAAFERNYRVIADGGALRPVQPQPGFADWARQLDGLAGTPRILGQESYWREVCGLADSSLPSAGEQQGQTARGTTPYRQLDAAATARFLARYPGAQQQHDALLAAFALAAARVLDQDEILARLENHGRHSLPGLTPNLSAGWMVCEHPLRLRGLAGCDATGAVAATADAMRALPDAGLGYGMLRHLRGRLTGCAEPRLGFTYRGRLDDVYRGQTRFRVLEIGAVAPALYANPSQPDLRLLAYLRGASLVWSAEFRPRAHPPERARRLVDQLGAVLAV